MLYSRIPLFSASVAIAALIVSSSGSLSSAEDEKRALGDQSTQAEAAAIRAVPKNPLDPDAQLRQFSEEYDVWIDSKNKHVIMLGEICLTRGPLEMFACLKGTKEHESVISVNTKAFAVHAALLALGAKSGSPAKYLPKYVPATGDPVEVLVFW